MSAWGGDWVLERWVWLSEYVVGGGMGRCVRVIVVGQRGPNYEEKTDMSVKAIPEGFHSVCPHLVVKGASDAIEFYKKAFGAEEVMRISGPDGKSVMHAEIKIGDSMIMLGDEFPGCEHGPKSPATLGGTTSTTHLYVEDADAFFAQALAAGAKETMPMTDMFWGDRFGSVADPFGHAWSIATHTRDVSPEECAEAAEKMFASM
jgi:PhnB protein